MSTPAEPGEPLATTPRKRTLSLAAEELRLVSALVVLMAIGLFLALPFVLSIGSVVFLPLVTAIILTIVLSPLADKLAQIGLPNFLASFLALALLLVVIALALSAVLRPALTLFQDVPAMIDRIGSHFNQLEGTLAWFAQINEKVAQIIGSTEGQQVVLAGPTMLEQLAFATPTVLLEVLLTFLMAFFMIEARVRVRRRLLLERQHFGATLKAARVMRDVQDRVAATTSLVGLALVQADQLAEARRRRGVRVARAVLVDGLVRALDELRERKDHARRHHVGRDEVEDDVAARDLHLPLHGQVDDGRRRVDALVPSRERERLARLAAGGPHDRPARQPRAGDDLLADALGVRVDVRPSPVLGALEARARMVASPEARRWFADGALFLGAVKTFLLAERVVLSPPR